MNIFSSFYQQIINTPLEPLLESIPSQLANWYKNERHGEFPKWEKLLDRLPQLEATEVDLKNSVSVSSSGQLDEKLQKHIIGQLKLLMPWRKGPFDIHGIHIDTEWRSDWKWERVLPHIAPLKNRYILDVGCGSGYHMWRMLGEEAKMVVGADPTQLFLAQFLATKHFFPQQNIHLLPLGIEALPEIKAYDTVFSMGVLYHRRSPFDFLAQLKNQLKPGGELVLETLVIEGGVNDVLVPGERYAKMRNVWFIPSCDAMLHWLQRAGFKNVKMVDKDQTSLDEQRATDWMTNQSLVDFLDKDDINKTVEGYPSPLRAVFVANT